VATTQPLPPSRTFALSAFGLVVLTGIAITLLIYLGIQVARKDPLGIAEALTALQVLAGCIAAVSAGGAGSMAIRDYGSRGLTSSAMTSLLSRPRSTGLPSVEAPKTETPPTRIAED